MIGWTDEAIEAALNAHDDCTAEDGSKQAMRAALDAAAEAQGLTAGWINRAVQDAHDDARAEAFEKAAKVAENLRDHENTDAWTITRAMAFNACAAAIRKHAKGEPPK